MTTWSFTSTTMKSPYPKLMKLKGWILESADWQLVCWWNVVSQTPPTSHLHKTYYKVSLWCVAACQITKDTYIIIFISLELSLFKFTWIIFLHVHLQVIYYNCVKFHKYWIMCLKRVVLARNMDGQTDGVSYIPPKETLNARVCFFI